VFYNTRGFSNCNISLNFYLGVTYRRNKDELLKLIDCFMFQQTMAGSVKLSIFIYVLCHFPLIQNIILGQTLS